MFKLKSLFAGAALSVLASGTALAQRCSQFVFYGDSLAQGMSQIAASRGMHQRNLAISGVGLLNGTAQNRSLLNHDYLNAIGRGNIVLVSLGTNDIAYFVNAQGRRNENREEEYFRDLGQRLADIKNRGGIPVVLGFSVRDYEGFSAQQRAYLNGPANRLLYRTASRAGAGFVATTQGPQMDMPRNDVPHDRGGLHYTGQGYATLLSNLGGVVGCPVPPGR